MKELQELAEVNIVPIFNLVLTEYIFFPKPVKKKVKRKGEVNIRN